MATTGDAAEPEGGDEQSRRAGFVELLFDVVLVFALVQLDERLVKDLTWPGFHAALLLFLALWWVWYRIAWTTNRYDPTRPAIQFMVIVTMLGSLLMAAAVPNAYGAASAVFAGVYVAVQVLRHLWLVLLGGDRYARLVSVRILFWAMISAVPWIAGIFTEAGPRLALWTVAVVIDYTGGVLDFPTPRLGRPALRGEPVAHEHLTERYRQLLIIAVGETILISGIQFSPYGFERARTVALIVSFTITVLLWQIYFYRAGALLPAAIASSKVPAHVGKLAAYAHLIMVVGVVLSSVGAKLVISQPLGHSEPTWTLLTFGGPALFLVGRGFFDYVAFNRVSWSRPIGLLLFAALAPATLRLPPLTVAVMAAAVMAATATANAVAWQLFPREPTPPPSQPTSH
jgi:low temperature requirement protein LtrA